ncbi:MAG: peptidoglycan editing factor PgeF [Deltaproteobacteria bacterium]|nr:peptidoglycan editing factor PgeF [Deltaproteobacteria bacterium]
MNVLNRTHQKSKNGIPYFENPEIEKLGWVIHGFLTRQGGVSLPPYDSLNVSFSNGDQKGNVFLNRGRITSAFGFEPNQLVLLKQMQLDGILILKDPVDQNPDPLKYDAMITNIPRHFLGIQTADCIPIFMVDQRKRLITAIHAGRQGTALGITKKALTKMKEWGCSEDDLLITLGPSIGPCCYEIDEKVFLKEWEPFSIHKGMGKWMLDLARINIAQLKEVGVKEGQIFQVDLCTRCHRDLFFSYRGEAQTGRQLSFIGILK